MILKNILSHTISFFFLLLFVSFFSFVCAEEALLYELSNWEVSLDFGKTWRKTKPVPWEFSESQGGIGVSHDGYGLYRTKFQIPENLKNKEIAFYTDCIDDADEEFLNGEKIGIFGRFPNAGYRSSAREARLSLLSPKNLQKGQNEITILVYDFAGYGGFCYLQKPVIGPFEILQKKERSHRMQNDLPRSVAIVLLILLTIRYLVIFIDSFSRIQKKEFIDTFLFPYLHLIGKNQEVALTFRTQLAYKAILTVFFCLTSVLFLLNEVTFKYFLIGSEDFFYKIPVIGFVLGETALIHIFYLDVFRRPKWFDTSRPCNYISRLFSFLSHPIISLVLFVYLIFLPPEKVWTDFTLFGIAILFLLLISLFTQTFVNLLLNVRYVQNKRLKKIIQRKTIFIILVLISLLVGFIFWFYFVNFLIAYSFLVMILFFQVYLWFSNSFLMQFRIFLPLTPEALMPLGMRLSLLGLTSTEVAICEMLYSGMSSEKIREKLNIALSTLKVHRKNIYRKTIEKHSVKGEISGENSKQQKLLFFLMNLKKR